MPKIQRIRRIEGRYSGGAKDTGTLKRTLESYMKNSVCFVCRSDLESDIPLCESCVRDADKSLFDLQRRINKAENRAVGLEKVCRSCAGLAPGEDVKCNSKECPVFFSRTRHLSILRNTQATLEPLKQILEDNDFKRYEW